MKNIAFKYNKMLFWTICLIISSCDTKEPVKVITTKEHVDAGVKTIENMQTAYKGEKTATAKYEAFSKKAEEEGFHNIALLYNAVSAAENIHATNHKAVIEDAGGIAAVIVPAFKVKSTKENLSDELTTKIYGLSGLWQYLYRSTQTL